MVDYSLECICTKYGEELPTASCIPLWIKYAVWGSHTYGNWTVDLDT